jgi:glycosyltransferase involved in cell wall biosynthesis
MQRDLRQLALEPRPWSAPHSHQLQVVWRCLGEVNEDEKADFLGSARALVFPMDWPEPFGLVMIEAMSCGTPVIAFKRGSVPEVIDEGLTGMVVETVEQAAEAVKSLQALDRNAVRATFERRFTAERLAADCMEIYRSPPGVRRAR